MYGQWLMVATADPAQNGEPAGSGKTFFGYDSKKGRWIVTGVTDSGGYFINYSNSPSFNDSQWHDGYPNMNGSAVVHFTPNTQYVVDSKGPNDQGKIVTEREVCTKQ